MDGGCVRFGRMVLWWDVMMAKGPSWHGNAMHVMVATMLWIDVAGVSNQ